MVFVAMMSKLMLLLLLASKAQSWFILLHYYKIVPKRSDVLHKDLEDISVFVILRDST